MGYPDLIHLMTSPHWWVWILTEAVLVLAALTNDRLRTRVLPQRCQQGVKTASSDRWGPLVSIISLLFCMVEPIGIEPTTS